MAVSVLLDHTGSWHAARKLGIGGSEAGKIMAGDWHPLWMLKTGRAEPEDLSRVLPVQLGSFTEPFHMAWFEQETGIPVSTADCGGLVHVEHGFMRANLDGRCPGAAWEAKHTSHFSKDDTIVTRYFPQCQHNMAVAGLPLMYLSVIFGNARWTYFEIAADADYQADMITREREFWGYVERDEPPPTVAAVDAPTIAFDDMREVDFSGSNEWASHAADWLETADAAKRYEAAGKGLRALVEADVKRATGHGVAVSRSKNNALTVRRMTK